MLNIKQGSIKNHFLSLWSNLTWDWTPVSLTIGEHTNNYANGPSDWRWLWCRGERERHQVPFFESLIWLDLGLNPGLPDHWRTLYSFGQWTGYKPKIHRFCHFLYNIIERNKEKYLLIDIWNLSTLRVVWSYLKRSSSSSYRAGSTDIPDPLSPLLPIVHRPR